MVACKGDIFRDMVLLAQNIGMNPGEYVFIFWFSLVDDPEVGKYTWERGDKLDKVGALLVHYDVISTYKCFNDLSFIFIHHCADQGLYRRGQESLSYVQNSCLSVSYLLT